VSRAIQALGGYSVAIYPSGGFYGGMLRHLLDREGLNHRPIPIRGWTREDLIIEEAATGRRFRFGMPGPRLSEKEWKAVLSDLKETGVADGFIVASGSLPPGVPDDFFARMADVAAEMDSRLVVDTSGKPLELALRAGAYMVKPNLRELSELAGRQIKDESEIGPLAKGLLQEGMVEAIVVSMAAAGAMLITKREAFFVRAPAVHVQSRVGAGDSLVAGIILALARGRTLREALRFGVAASSAAVMSPGIDLCSRGEAERLYQIIRNTGSDPGLSQRHEDGGQEDSN